MRKLGKVHLATPLLTAGLLGSMVCAAQSADLPTKVPALATVPSCVANAAAYFQASPADCPLTWNGITLYGDIDTGAGYQTHGVPLNGVYPNGVEHLISKNSNSPGYSWMPNGLGQSHIGIKGIGTISGDWSFIFNFQTGFDPYSLQLANGPKSLVQNNTNPLEVQSANGDSSRAGQLFNTVAYGGLTNPVWGTLTVGRQNSLILDGLGLYDAMAAAPAFSVIGVSSTAGAPATRRTPAMQHRSSTGPILARFDWPRFISSAGTAKATVRTAPWKRNSVATSEDSRSTPSLARLRMRCHFRIMPRRHCPPAFPWTI
jgi:Gram-negative porin